METKREQWQNSAQKVLHAAMSISIVAIVGLVVIAILAKPAYNEILGVMAAEAFDGSSSDASATISFVMALGLVLLTISIAQGLYAYRIGRFAKIWKGGNDYRAIRRVRNGAYMQLAALVLMIAIPLLSETIIDTKNDALILCALLAPWVAAITGTITMRIGSSKLLFNYDLNDNGLEATGNLQHAATCQLRLLIMPLVYGLFLLLLVVLLKNALENVWEGAEVSILNLDQLFQQIREFEGRANKTITTLRLYYYIYLIITAIFTFFALLWALFAVIRPVTGWNRMMKGLERQEDEDETVAINTGNRIVNLLERPGNWLYTVIAGVLTALLFLPLLTA